MEHSQKFEVGFPSLYQFWAGWFSDPDEDMDDEQIIHSYLLIANATQKELLLAELMRLLPLLDQYWECVSIVANRYFTNAPQVQVWILKLVKLIEQTDVVPNF